MITGFFLSLGLSVLTFFITLLPVAAFPSGITNAVNTIWGYINAVSFLLPVGTLVSVLAIAFAFHTTILLWRIVNYVMGYLRGNH